MDQSEFNILVSMDDCSQTVEKKRRQKMMSYVVSFLRKKKKENCSLSRRSIQNALNNAFFLHSSDKKVKAECEKKESKITKC